MKKESRKKALKIGGGLLSLAGFAISFFSDKINSEIQHDEMVETVKEQVDAALSKKFLE